jgi:hypothetical protein
MTDARMGCMETKHNNAASIFSDWKGFALESAIYIAIAAAGFWSGHVMIESTAIIAGGAFQAWLTIREISE